MIVIENKTRWNTEDLRVLILAALREAGIAGPGHRKEIVRILGGGGGYHGWCFLGTTKPRKRGADAGVRMKLYMPDPKYGLDLRHLAWLVWHEVGHWQGLRHSKMGLARRHWHRCGVAFWPMPAWVEGLTVRLEDVAAPAAPPAPSRVSSREVLRAKKLKHAQAMLAKAERRAKLAAAVLKRWRRCERAAELSIARAATKAKAGEG